MGRSIRDYFFQKLVFPKRAIIDKPGILINQLSRRYGGVKSRHRTVYYFEDILAGLQRDTIKKIGEKKTKELYSSIGRKGMERYLLHGEHKKAPEFLIPSILKYMFDGFVSAGYSSAKDFDYNFKTKEVILRGEDNIVCRKSGCSEQFCGGLAVLMESLMGGSFEVRTSCSTEKCKGKCNLVISPCGKREVRDAVIDVSIEEDYKKLNFPDVDTVGLGFCSMGDFVRFKKAWFDTDGKFCFEGKVIGPIIQDFFGIIEKHYEDIGEIDFFRETISREAKKVMLDILGDRPLKERVKFLNSIICSFGFGIPYLNQKKEKIELKLLYPPINKFGFDYHASVFEGFLEASLKKELILNEVILEKRSFSITLVYDINR